MSGLSPKLASTGRRQLNPGSVTGNSATGDGDCACGVGDRDSSRGALAGVEAAGDPDATPEGEPEPHAHSKIAAIEATALMTVQRLANATSYLAVV